jgi:hypothetical protein
LGGKQDSAPSLQRSQVATPPAVISEELYENARLLPNSKTNKWLYPLAPVQSLRFTTEEYEYQFEVVKDKLKEIVDKDDDLRLRGRFILYSLHMVGTTPHSAVPTIVVECISKDLKNIRAAFKRHSTDNFYCHHESRILRKAVSGSANIPPPFRIVYWGDDRDPCERRAAETAMKASLSRDSTFCGSLVTFQGRSATLALTLAVDSVDFVLTAGHIKSSQHGSESSVFPSFEDSDDGEATLNGDHYVEIGPLWVDDDDEYEMEAAVLQPLPPPSLTSGSSSPNCLENKSVTPLEEMRPVKLSASLSPNAPDLDWMPLQGDENIMRARRRNFIYLPGHHEPILLEKIADKPRIHAVPVFVLSGIRGVIQGRMLGMPSFIGSGPGRKLCKAWTVVLDDQLGKWSAS